MIAFSCQDIRKSETVKMNTFQKNKSMQIERSKSTCRFENHLTKDQQKHTNFICQKIIKKFRLISKLNLGWLVNLIYVNFWPKFQSVNQQIYVNFDISKITNLRDSRWLFVAGAAFGDILGDSRNAKCCIFPYKMRLQDGTSKVSEAAGARWRFHARIILGICSNRLSIGGSNSGIFRWHLELRISWQAQYLVMLDSNQCCSAHCKWRFICDAD